MADMDDRDELLRKDVLLVATAGVSLLNGMPFSPLMGQGLPIGPVSALLRPFLAGTVLSSPLVFYYLTSIFCSLMTLLIAGIPAALYERMRGQADSSSISIGIWFACTLLLALPSFLAMAGGAR